MPRSSWPCWLMVASVSLATLTVIVPKPGGTGEVPASGPALAMVLVVLTWAFDVVQTGVQSPDAPAGRRAKFLENGAF